MQDRIFAETETGHVTPRFRYGYLALGGAMLGFSLWAGIGGTAGWTWLFGIAVSVYLLSLWARVVRVDIQSRELAISDLFAFEKRYAFSDVVRVRTIRYVAFGFLPNGADVAVTVRAGASEQDVTLFRRVQSVKRAELIAGELRGLLDGRG